MGLGNSIAIKKKRGVGGKYYRPPDVRQKDRYEPEESLNLSSQNDASIDKVRSSVIFTKRNISDMRSCFVYLTATSATLYMAN